MFFLVSLLKKGFYVLVFSLLLVISIRFLIGDNNHQRSQVLSLSSNIFGGAFSKIGSIREYVNLVQKNTLLIEDIVKLEKENRSLKMYKRLLQDSVNVELLEQDNIISGNVVRSSFGSNPLLVIDKGLEDGVTTHSFVYSVQGVIGRVLRVNSHYSIVMPITNKAVKMLGQIKDSTSARGILFSKEGNIKTCFLQDIPIHYKVEVGDTVITAGNDAIMPANINIGTVLGSKMVKGLYLEVEIMPFVNFTNVDNVFIFTPKEEVTSTMNYMDSVENKSN